MNLLKLQDQLKGMPDAYLTQMVQQPDGQIPQFLVLGELQRRKDMRDASQQAPQSTVAEDVVQEGLGALQPQQAPVEEESEQIDQGIAAIPTQMEEAPAMAGGGIIAFDKGGDVPSILQGGATQDERIKKLLDIFKGKTLLDVVGPKPRGGYVPTAEDLAPPVVPMGGLTDAEIIANAQRDRLLAEIGGGMYTPTPKPDRGYPATPSYPSPKISWQDIPGTDARFEELKREVRSPEQAMGEYRRLVGEDQGLAGLKDKLAKMEEKAKGEEERAPWMALVRAGLGMAAGTSPFALTNIGAGGLEGLKDYQAAQDRIKAAEERRFDVQTKLAQAERAEQIAAAKYGLDSRQADQAREDRRMLEKLKAGLDIDTANAKGRFEAEKGQAMVDVDLAQLAETSRYHQAAIAAEREKTGILRESGLETKRQQQATNLLKVIMQPMIAQAKASMGLTDEEAYDQVFPQALQKLPANMRGALGYDESTLKSLSGPTGPRKKPLSAFEK